MSILLKKFTSAVSAAAVAFVAVAPSITNAASGFAPYAEALAKAKIITTQSNEAGYRLADSAMRQEVAAMMIALNKADTSATTCSGKFSDVSATKPNSWVCKVVETALSKGLIAANATFRPEANITRAEALAMILKGQGIEIATGAAASFNDTPIAWQKDVANTALSKKIISANASFRPNASVTRGELFVMAANAAGLEIASASDDLNLDDLFGDTGTGTTATGTTSTGTTTVVTGGDLNIGLNPASMPNGTNVPKVGTFVLSKLDLTAGSSDTIVNSIKLKRDGLGTNSEITNVWFEQGGKRIATKASVLSDSNATVSFLPSLTIKAGATETVDLVVVLSGSSAGSQHRFMIENASSISTNGTIKGNFPLYTSSVTTANYSASSITVSKNANATSTVKVGDNSAVLGDFRLALGNENRDVVLKSITLYNSGTADLATSTQNIALYNKATGEKVSTSVSLNGRYITFTSNDKILYTNSTRSYQVKADIASAERNNDSLNLSFDNKPEYIVVDELTTGYRAVILGITDNSSVYNLGASAIELGDFSIVRDTSVSSVTVAKNTNDVLLMAGTIKPGQAVTMENITVNFTGSTANFSSGVTRVKLVIGDTSAVMDAANSVTFQNTYAVSKETSIKVYADIKADATPSTYSATSLSIGTLRYSSNDQTVASPTNALTSNTISATVSNPTVTVSNNGSASTAQTVIGAKDLSLSKLALANNNLSDVTVSSLAFNTGSSTWSGAGLNDTTVYLFVNGEQKESRKIKDGSLQFTSTTLKIAKGATTYIELKVNDISTSYGTGNLQVAYSTGSFVDETGNDATVSGTPTGTLFTLNDKGSATFAVLPTDNQAKIITPGTGVELGKFTVNATNDSIKLLDLYASFSGVTDASKYVSNIKLVSGNSEYAGSIVAGTLKFTSVNSGNGIEILRGADPITLTVKADVLSLASADDGTTLGLKLGAADAAHIDDAANVADLAVKFRSNATSQYLASADVTTPATVVASHRVANSVFTITGAAGTTNDEHKFVVTVPSNLSRIALTDIVANISTGTTLTGTLYVGSISSANQVATWDGSAFTIEGSSTTNSTVVLNAGSTTTFILKLNGVTSSNNANSIRTLNITNVSYKDYVDGVYATSPLSTSSYVNVGLPVSSSTTY